MLQAHEVALIYFNQNRKPILFLLTFKSFLYKSIPKKSE